MSRGVVPVSLAVQVMGHSGEGRLVSGHAVPVCVVMAGRQIARKTTVVSGHYWASPAITMVLSAGALGRFRGRRNA